MRDDELIIAGKKTDTVKKIFLYTVGSIAVFVLWINRKALGEILFPLILAAILAFIVRPAAAALEKVGMKLKHAVISVFLVVITAAAAIIILAYPALTRQIRDISAFFLNMDVMAEEIMNTVFSLNLLNALPDTARASAANQLKLFLDSFQNIFFNSFGNFIDVSINVVKTLIDISLAAVIAYYLLIDTKDIYKSIFRIIPRRMRGEALKYIRDISKILRGFIKGQLKVCLIVGVIEFLGLRLIGIPYAPVLGLIGGISNLIPYFGPYIGAVPAIITALTQSIWQAAAAAVVFVAAQVIDNIFVSPRILSGKTGIHPITSIISIYAAGRLFGTVAMIFAVPAAGIIKLTFINIQKLIFQKKTVKNKTEKRSA